MKLHTTNYFNTFIEVAEDCPVDCAEIPPLKNNGKTVASLQFEMIKEHPYKYTSDDILFKVHSLKNEVPAEDSGKELQKFFSKGQACFRSSPLTKRYGWGVHSNQEGKVAIYAVESEDYKKYSRNKDLKCLKAMRSKRV